MKKVFEEMLWYALGRKGITHKSKHGKAKENKNVTYVQDLLSELPKNDKYFNKLFQELVKKNG